MCPPAGFPPAPCGSVGAVINRPENSAMLMADPFHPPFSFRSCRKENGPWTVQKKRTLLTRSGAVALRATGVGVRWCLRVRDGSSTGAAWCGTDLTADSRGAGTDENRGAKPHLTSSSFRAFRFATRCPGGRGGLYHTGPKTFPHPRRGRCPHRPVGESSQKECRGGNLPPAETDMIMSQPQHQEKSAARWPRLIFELE